MKLPSLTPRQPNKRFEFTPRYYDPIKEDIKNRTDLIRRELQGEHTDLDTESPTYGLRIKGAYSRRATPASSNNSGALRLLIIAILGLFCYAYFTSNNIAFIVLFLILGLYFWARKKGLLEKSDH
jgi:hypothetical protein